MNSRPKAPDIHGVFLNTSKKGIKKLDFKNDSRVDVYLNGMILPTQYRREGDFLFLKEPFLGSGIERQLTIESPTRIFGGPSMDGSDPDVWVKKGL